MSLTEQRIHEVLAESGFRRLDGWADSAPRWRNGAHSLTFEPVAGEWRFWLAELGVAKITSETVLRDTLASWETP